MGGAMGGGMGGVMGGGMGGSMGGMNTGWQGNTGTGGPRDTGIFPFMTIEGAEAMMDGLVGKKRRRR